MLPVMTISPPMMEKGVFLAPVAGITETLRGDFLDFENIGFGLRMAKSPEIEVKRRVLEVTELLGLERWLTAKPRHLSGGMHKRVALGLAIARNASLYLMDEPLSNLDALLRVKTRTEVIKLARST